MSYQGQLDKLAAMADVGNWAGIEAHQAKGINTYGKLVARYRDALLDARPRRRAA
jgi:hypothetical protein